MPKSKNVLFFSKEVVHGLRPITLALGLSFQWQRQRWLAFATLAVLAQCLR